MRVKILGKYWQLNRVPNLAAHGDCSPPDSPDKEIRIAAGTRGQLLTDTIIHEAIHAAGWHIDEPFVDQLATDIARILHKPEIAKLTHGEST